MHLGLHPRHGYDCARHRVLVFIEERNIVQAQQPEELDVFLYVCKGFLRDMSGHARLSAQLARRIRGRG